MPATSAFAVALASSSVIVDGAFTAKVMTVLAGRRSLVAAHPAYPAIPWRDGCEVWGTVTSVHRDLTATGR